MPHCLSPKCDQRFFSKLPDSYQNHGQVAAPSPDEEGNIYEEPNVDQESNISEIKKDKTSPVGKVLTLRQLLLRRGLALLVMVLILAAGIVASELLVRYLKWAGDVVELPVGLSMSEVCHLILKKSTFGSVTKHWLAEEPFWCFYNLVVTFQIATIHYERQRSHIKATVRSVFFIPTPVELFCIGNDTRKKNYTFKKTKNKYSIFNPTLLACSLLLKPMPCWTFCRFRNGQKQGGSKVVSEQ